MRLSIFIYMFSILTVSAQIADSVSIKELVVTADLPVNNRSLMVFYQSSSLSSVDDLLNRMDGVNMIKRGAYALEPLINGFSGGQINLTIDGMKMFGACTDKMDPITSYIEPVNLKNIQVNSGTRSIEHGVNLGGSLNLALDEVEFNSNDSSFVEVGFGYETNASNKIVDVSAGLAKMNLSWGLNGVFRKSQNYKTGLGDRVDYSQYEKMNLHSVFKYKWALQKQIKADLLFDRAMNVGYPALPMDVSLANAVLIGLEYLSPGFKAKVYANDVVHVMDDSQRDSLYSVKNYYSGQLDSVYMRMDMPGRSSTAGVYFEKWIEVSSNNHLKLKLDNYINRSIAEMTMYMRFKDGPAESPMYLQSWPDMLRNVLGFYATDSWNLNSFIELNTSFRIDYLNDLALNDLLENQFSVLNYNLSKRNSNYTKGLNMELIYHMSHQLRTKFNMGWAERAPTHSELYGYYLYNAFDGYDYIGNPLLKNEKSVFTELNLNYSSSKIRINLAQNLNVLKDYIYSKNSLVPPMNLYAKGIRQYINYPNALIYNAGLQWMWVPFSNLQVLSNSSYSLGQLIEGEPIPFMSPFNHFLTVSYSMNEVQLVVENEFASQQSRVNLAFGESRTPSYSVFNMRANKSFKLLSSTFSASVGVTNLFNQAYYTHLDWAKILRPGRSVSLYLKSDL